MKKNMTFLGIETSCDETAASVVKENEDNYCKYLIIYCFKSNKKTSEVWRGCPRTCGSSSRGEYRLCGKLSIKKSRKTIEDIDGIATTAGPGLIVCLSVGVNIAKIIAALSNKPLIPVNHLEGHALSPSLTRKINFPYLLLLISGGHSQFLIVNDVNKFIQLGTTIDDALGEAFDKTSKMLGFGYPGGPQIERLAKKGNPMRFKLPQPIINKAGCNLSFAGLKTAVLRETKKIKTTQEKYDLAASFQETINKILEKNKKLQLKSSKKKRKNLVFLL